MSSKLNQPHNPYAAAAGAYGSNAQKNAGNPRELEARVLLKAAQFMQDIQGDWDKLSGDDLSDILKYNRTIWMMFYDTATENADGSYPDDLRANIANLSAFIFKREMEILSSPVKEKMDVLISINRNIAEGLLKNVKATADTSSQTSVSQNPDIKNPPVGGTDRSA